MSMLFFCEVDPLVDGVYQWDKTQDVGLFVSNEEEGRALIKYLLIQSVAPSARL